VICNANHAQRKLCPPPTLQNITTPQNKQLNKKPPKHQRWWHLYSAKEYSSLSSLMSFVWFCCVGLVLYCGSGGGGGKLQKRLVVFSDCTFSCVRVVPETFCVVLALFECSLSSIWERSTWSDTPVWWPASLCIRTYGCCIVLMLTFAYLGADHLTFHADLCGLEQGDPLH